MSQIMAKQPRVRTKVAKTRTGADIAEERIAEYMRGVRRDLLTQELTSGASFDLSLARLGLSSIPESVRGLQHVDILDFSENEITELPEWIGEIHAYVVVLN